jgi:hypothetical protein
VIVIVIDLLVTDGRFLWLRPRIRGYPLLIKKSKKAKKAKKTYGRI